MQIRRLAIVANRTKNGTPELAEELASLAKSSGVISEIFFAYPLADGALSGFDACAVLGGDGTLLGVVPEAARRQVPLFGINRGKLGFLANYPSENARESLRDVLRGEFQIVRRALLECDIGEKQRAVALNDVVIKTAEPAQMGCLRVSSRSGVINTYRGDGVIVATPTGSTAYNLAAGGPLLDPNSDMFAITPICPHTLSNRSLIVPRETVIIVENRGRVADISISVDGVETRATHLSFPLILRVAQATLPLIQPRGFSHYELLRTKLQWN